MLQTCDDAEIIYMLLGKDQIQAVIEIQETQKRKSKTSDLII